VRQITKTLEQFELRWMVQRKYIVILVKNEKEEEKENM
jgi:diketogulonate reductase-like aldo/keto reductase